MWRLAWVCPYRSFEIQPRSVSASSWARLMLIPLPYSRPVTHPGWQWAYGVGLCSSERKEMDFKLDPALRCHFSMPSDSFYCFRPSWARLTFNSFVMAHDSLQNSFAEEVSRKEKWFLLLIFNGDSFGRYDFPCWRVCSDKLCSREVLVHSEYLNVFQFIWKKLFVLTE